MNTHLDPHMAALAKRTAAVFRAESAPGGALRRYETAVANAELIGASGWQTLALDLCDAADAIERDGGSVEQQRKLRARAEDCAARRGKAERATDALIGGAA